MLPFSFRRSRVSTRMVSRVLAISAVATAGLMTAHESRAQSAGLVISQAYGGGGNNGATYNRDFIELFNGTGSAISLTTYSIQYASATGAFNGRFTLTGTIASGGFYLIGLASGGSNGSALPVTDASTTSIDLSATAGKIALANTTAATQVTFNAGSSMFTSGNVVDFVGYGTTADAYEGNGRAPAPSATRSIIRETNPPSTVGGTPTNYIDTNNNNTDFATITPGPRNSLSPNPFGSNFVASGAVPEPGTFALLSAAAPLGVVVRRRLRR